MSYEFPLPTQKRPEHESGIEQETAAERRLRAESICQAGNYETILATFALPGNKEILGEQMERLKKKEVQHNPHEAGRHLRDHDWEMLTILELFDRATFEHCIRTYQVARQKIESSGPIGAYLREHLQTEGLTPWDIELACLLHDMGKIALVPKDLLLNNTLSNSDWHGLFEQFCHESCGHESGRYQSCDNKEARDTVASYETKLAENPLLREKDITPFSLCLSPEQNEYLKTVKNIDTSLSLGALIEQHQDISVDIASRYYPEGSPMLELIGNHHERKLSADDSHAVSQSTVRLSSLIATLRLADVYDAVHSARAYKKEEAIFSSLSVLIAHTEQGTVDRELTKLWIEDELTHFDPKAYLHTLKTHTSPRLEKEKVAYEKIQAFLVA